jgi:hypothetical protein
VVFLSGAAFAQTPETPDVNPYTDPAVQDFVETVYGYRNPANARLINDFRDSLTSLRAEDKPRSASLGPQDNGISEGQTGLFGPVTQKYAGFQQGISGGRVTENVSQISTQPEPGQYYKVTFAYESGPLSSYVGPLDPNALSGFKAGDYVFITVLPGMNDHRAFIETLAGTGFKFAGEKTYFTGGRKKTFLLGWAPYSKLAAIRRHPQVRGLVIEKKTPGVPYRTRIRFTLRAPGGERAGVFVAEFVRRLSSSTGFTAENSFRLPQNSRNAKFAAFEVTGSLPVEMVGEISRSPFVAAVEFHDKSL